jgi:hypothetical protein
MFTSTRRGRLGGLAAAIAVLALVIVAAAGATRTTGGVTYVYNDKAGDSATAPDIQKVVLTDQGNGLVGVEIDLAAIIPDDGSMLVFGIDADRNSQTGDPLGLDYFVGVDASGPWLMQWNGTQWSPANHQPAGATVNGGQIGFTLTLSDFSVTNFNFIVLSFHGDDGDAAPEFGSFTYPDPAARPAIAAVVLSASALLPTAGKTFAVPPVQLKLTTGVIVAADATTVALTYKGQALKPLRHWAWKIPKTYKGKHLTLKVTATYQGSTRTISLPVVVR